MLDQCVHSRNLFPFYNSNENSQKYNFIANHLESCGECQSKYTVMKESGKKIKILVPRKEITNDLQAMFELEIKNVVGKSLKQKKDVESFGFIPTYVKNHIRDIYSALTSRTLVRAYLLCGVYLLIIKSLSSN